MVVKDYKWEAKIEKVKIIIGDVQGCDYKTTFRVKKYSR